MLFDVFGASGILKREAQPPHLPHLVATRSQHTFTHTIQGVRTMDTLLLNARTVRQQPTGIPKKVVSILLTSCSLSGPGEQKGVQATNRHPNKKVVSKMLTSCSLLFGCRARRADASRAPSLKEDSTMRYLFCYCSLSRPW